MTTDFLKDYIQVKDRVQSFYKDNPDGRVQTEMVHLSDTLVIMKASVYRGPDDPRPTTGHAWGHIPGLSRFTQFSELQNAETHAVGRALAMCGYHVSVSMATRDEIEATMPDAEPQAFNAPRPAAAPVQPAETKTVTEGANTCPEHKVPWTQRPQGHWSHPIAGTVPTDWCNQPKWEKEHPGYIGSEVEETAE